MAKGGELNMLNKARLTGAIATGAVLAGVLLPAAAHAATNVTVTGNGADSKNKVKIKEVKKTNVIQTNAAAVVNLVGVVQNTGGNKANKNTGGSVNITSGNASATVSNTTTTGGNVAVVEDCGCESTPSMIDISENGKDSTNKVKVKNVNVNTTVQSNYTMVVNSVMVAQNTGHNTANGNTKGDVMITSGDADTTVENTVETGSNVVSPSMP